MSTGSARMFFSRVAQSPPGQQDQNHGSVIFTTVPSQKQVCGVTGCYGDSHFYLGLEVEPEMQLERPPPCVKIRISKLDQNLLGPKHASFSRGKTEPSGPGSTEPI